MVHSISKRSNHENFKIHSPYNRMAYITVFLVYIILSLIYVIVLDPRAPHTLMVLFLIQITILFKYLPLLLVILDNCHIPLKYSMNILIMNQIIGGEIYEPL